MDMESTYEIIKCEHGMFIQYHQYYIECLNILIFFFIGETCYIKTGLTKRETYLKSFYVCSRGKCKFSKPAKLVLLFLTNKFDNSHDGFNSVAVE